MKRKFGSDKVRRAAARKVRVARRLANSDVPLLTVYRSSKHIYALLVDTENGKTIATVSSCSKSMMGSGADSGKIDMAKRVGKAIAEVAREKNIEKVAFNRNGFLYHGRVKALADAAREAGLQF
jgi:large subunit ribosomal protein L18